MLHIYTDKKYVPSDLTIIDDPDVYIIQLDMTLDETTASILREIEQAKPLSKQRVLDRFDTALYPSDMSTSAKILIEAHQTNDVIIADELGMSAYENLFLVKDGHLLFLSIDPDLSYCEYPLMYNGKLCNTESDTWMFGG